MFKRFAAGTRRRQPLRSRPAARRRALERLEPRWVLDSVVVFNELMYHPADGDTRGEWIELRNLLSVDVDLSDWSITGGVRFTFPAGTTIPADGYLLVAAQPLAWPNASPRALLGPLDGALNNAGDTIELRNNSGRRMDVVSYDDRGDWPVAADGAGPSLAKRDPYWTSTDATNWEPSYSTFGTPGYENLPTIDLTPRPTQVVPLDSIWRYHAAGVDLGTAWRSADYVDADWLQGRAIFAAGRSQPTENQLHIVALDPTGDGEISSLRTYTHAIDFGNADSGAEVNGLRFTPANASGVGSLEDFQWRHSSGIRTHGQPSGAAPLAGPLRDLYEDYVANTLNLVDGTVEITLTDLEPGQWYRTRLYGRRADDASRRATFEFHTGGDLKSITLDQNSPPIGEVDAPYAVEFQFQATDESLTIKAIQHDATKPWYWYGLTNELASLTGATELPLGPTTYYFRTTFAYAADALTDHQLRLRLHLDDGAVVYLNGQEIHRQNLPAGEIRYSTPAQEHVTGVQPGEMIELPADALWNGTNTLAVEVHQALGGTPDVRFGSELTVVATPRPPMDPPTVAINELPAAGSATRWIELINHGVEPVSLGDLALEVQGNRTSPIALPDVDLAPGQVISIAAGASASWLADDRIVLYRADRSSVVDAQVLADRPQARHWDQQGRWRFPDTQTPGEENRFRLFDDLVINEIMYHPAPTYADGDQPFAESPDEWLEIHNRGTVARDLAGWSLGGGIDYVFPAGTTIPAGGYLVVAADAERLAQFHPGINVVGNFSGRLSNQGELIVLRDPSGNPADEVHYYDSGGWPSYADGGGSSLELRDPRADNSKAEAWGASREQSRSEWVTIEYEGTARQPQGSNDPTEWNELILGLLDSGELLLDDVSVIEDPDGAAIERIQNGSFSQGAAHWRFVGNHGQHGRTQVIADPDDPQNSVLHVVATGATEHMSNHLETTFADGARINAGTTYRISLRARWLAGSPQLHSRLYFNRLAAVHILPQPAGMGTPGRENSQRIANLGPTMSDLAHSPAVPDPGQSVTVTVAVSDPDSVSDVQLLFAEQGQPWQSVAMTRGEADRFSATIPGKAKGALVQFYVRAIDGLGNVSLYPAAGENSRALYKVNDSAATDGPRHNLRILMTEGDLDEMFTRTNFTSNERMGATVIWQESQVYYDVDMRLKGSGFSRGSAATGFNLSFPPERLLYGEHDTVSIDRQGGPWGIGASHRELTIKHIANRAGDIPMMYDDVIHLIGPRDSHNGSAQFLVARYDDVFLDSQYVDGSQGTRFKFELIYYSTLTVDGDPEGLKLAPGSMRAGVFPVRGVDMPYMGTDPNAYRWYYLIRNNRDRDDYEQIIALTEALSKTGSTVGGELDRLTQQVMDVDQWMRVFAFESLAGINDTFNQGLEHNLQLFVRPEDQRVVPLPWDMDFALHQNTSMSIYGTGSRLTRVINIPTNRRLFQQHLLDIINTSYNEEYLDSWVRHLATRAQRDETTAILNYVRARRSFVLDRLAPQIPFEITTPGSDQLVVDTPYVTLEGRGWVDVREIRVVGQTAPPPVEWLDFDRWRVVVPLQQGPQTIELQAYDLRGNQVGSATAHATTSASNPLAAGLRVTELNYHPADPSPAERAAGWSDAEAFEFIELTNIAPVPLNLGGVRFARDVPGGTGGGIDFAFPPMTLPPGESVVVVNHPLAFAFRYGDEITPVGRYEGRLSNAGEELTLVGPNGELLQRIRYDDAWYAATDGGGASLEVRSPATTRPEAWSNPATWMASRVPGGTPGRAVNPDLSGDGALSHADIDLLCAAIAAHETADKFDLNDDRRVDQEDLDYLVVSAMRSKIGDANLDGRFNSSDLVQIFQRGHFEDTIPGNSTWADGDWNCDGDFTTADLVFALQRSVWETD